MCHPDPQGMIGLCPSKTPGAHVEADLPARPTAGETRRSTMNATITDALNLEHQLRDKRADLLGPHLFDLDLRSRRDPRRQNIRARVGRALVELGTWLQGTSPLTAVPAQG